MKSFNIVSIEFVFENCDTFKFHRTHLKYIELGNIATSISSANSGTLLTVFSVADNVLIKFDAKLLKKKTRFGEDFSESTLGYNLKLKHITSVYIETANQVHNGYTVPWDDTSQYTNTLESSSVENDIVTLTIGDKNE